jgi:hypothetical protein
VGALAAQCSPVCAVLSCSHDMISRGLSPSFSVWLFSSLVYEVSIHMHAGVQDARAAAWGFSIAEKRKAVIDGGGHSTRGKRGINPYAICFCGYYEGLYSPRILPISSRQPRTSW